MQLTLIMSTRGRVAEIGRFLASIPDEEHGRVALFMCDQNDDDRLAPLIADWQAKLPITVVRSAMGAARGRNAALAAATRTLGSQLVKGLVSFPDDDCWYRPDTLARVRAAFTATPALDGITARSLDETGHPGASRSPALPMTLTMGNLLRHDIGIAYCMFFRGTYLKHVPGFDDELGVGAGTRWGSGEESDFLLRGIRAGQRIDYLPQIGVHHPAKGLAFDYQRFYSYALGHGRLLRKNGYSPAYLARDVATAGGAFLVRSAKRRRPLWAYLGRMRGYLEGYAARP